MTQVQTIIDLVAKQNQRGCSANLNQGVKLLPRKLEARRVMGQFTTTALVLGSISPFSCVRSASHPVLPSFSSQRDTSNPRDSAIAYSDWYAGVMTITCASGGMAIAKVKIASSAPACTSTWSGLMVLYAPAIASRSGVAPQVSE
eukprot:CAMPEP_0204498888 /NCGR_PEP_ID=MMETSP0471-20130131/93887_1 /ASSEMBLY_ACC=CAM_ASM_000602 /TAXON_ID=2969 /ORGANISM="Oxyrrhis marina" /LENGTH=144 /DNA_ID=CAMNT_0051503387 /DNA_START=19 /DNA_END=454 /DNA_ORIENTATION=+